MSNYTVAEAENMLDDLIDRALQGEHVVITRDETPLIEFKPIEAVTLVAKPIKVER